MFKFGKKCITLAVEIQKTHGFLTILEDKSLGDNVSFWRLEQDKEFRVYEFEATEDEYNEVLDDLDAANIRYKIRFTDCFGRDMYIGLI